MHSHTPASTAKENLMKPMNAITLPYRPLALGMLAIAFSALVFQRAQAGGSDSSCLFWRLRFIGIFLGTLPKDRTRSAPHK